MSGASPCLPDFANMLLFNCPQVTQDPEYEARGIGADRLHDILAPQFFPLLALPGLIASRPGGASETSLV